MEWNYATQLSFFKSKEPTLTTPDKPPLKYVVIKFKTKYKIDNAYDPYRVF